MLRNSAADTFYGGFTASKIRRLIRRAVIFPADFRRTNIRRRIRRSTAAEGSNLNAVVPPSLSIQDREHGRNLQSTSTMLCQPFKTTTFAKRAFRCSAPAVWNSLPQTVLSSDSDAVFMSRLKTFLFLLFLCSLTRCLAPAPLKLQPYGAIQICLLLLLLLLL